MGNNGNNTYQALWVGIGSLSSLLLALVSSAILSRYFDKTEYGTYRQILYVYNTLLIIFSAGLPRVFSYFLPRYTVEQGKDIVWKITKLLFLFGFIFSSILFLGSGVIARILKNPDLALGLKYFSPIPFLLLPTLGIEGIFSSYKKTIYIAIYNSLSRLLMLGFIVLPVVLFRGTYLYAIYGWVIVSVISLIIALYFKRIPFKEIKAEKANLKLKEIFAYSFPLVGASLGGTAIHAADQFYISRYFGIEVFAEFANGFIQIPFVGMVTSATSMVLMPQFSRMIHEKSDLYQLTSLWKSALIKSAILIYPMVIFFFFQAKTIVTLLYSDRYINSAFYFQIIMIVNFFNIIIFAPLLLSLGATKYYMKVQILGATLAWIGGFLIVKIFPQPLYIALLSICVTILLIIINMYKISKLLSINIYDLIPLKSFLKIIVHSLIVILIVLSVTTNLDLQNSFFLLLINFIGFLTFLLLTSIPFKIDYLFIAKSLIKK